jgi:hypothetical protein
MLGGLGIAAFGISGVLIIDTATFMISAWSAALILSVTPKQATARVQLTIGHVFTDAKLGLSYVMRKPWLAVALLSSAIQVFAFAGPFEVLFPLRVKQELHFSATDYGILLLTFGLGCMVVALLFSRWTPPVRSALGITYSVWGLAVAMLIPLALGMSMPILAVATAISGGGFTAGLIIWGTLIQSVVPRELLGRVASVDEALTVALTPLSFAIVGTLAARAGTSELMIIGGILGSVIPLTLFALFSQARRPEIDLSPVAERNPSSVSGDREQRESFSEEAVRRDRSVAAQPGEL